MRQRVWSGVFLVIGLCAAVAALAWPACVERIAQSRWVLGLFSAWCFAFSGYLSGAWAAFADAIRSTTTGMDNGWQMVCPRETGFTGKGRVDGRHSGLVNIMFWDIHCSPFRKAEIEGGAITDILWFHLRP